MDYFIIGERELVLAFGLVGVKGAAVSSRDEALESFNKVTGQSEELSAQVSTDIPRVLILTENVSVMLEEEITDWQLKEKFPLIVEIPPLEGKVKGKKSLSDSIREAVGISV